MAVVMEKKKMSSKTGAAARRTAKKPAAAKEAADSGLREAKQSSGMIIADLLEKGKRNGGTLTYGEVVAALQTQDISPDEIEALFA